MFGLLGNIGANLGSFAGGLTQGAQAGIGMAKIIDEGKYNNIMREQDDEVARVMGDEDLPEWQKDRNYQIHAGGIGERTAQRLREAGLSQKADEFEKNLQTKRDDYSNRQWMAGYRAIANNDPINLAKSAAIYSKLNGADVADYEIVPQNSRMSTDLEVAGDLVATDQKTNREVLGLPFVRVKTNKLDENGNPITQDMSFDHLINLHSTHIPDRLLNDPREFTKYHVDLETAQAKAKAEQEKQFQNFKAQMHIWAMRNKAEKDKTEFVQTNENFRSKLTSGTHIATANIAANGKLQAAGITASRTPITQTHEQKAYSAASSAVDKDPALSRLRKVAYEALDLQKANKPITADQAQAIDKFDRAFRSHLSTRGVSAPVGAAYSYYGNAGTTAPVAAPLAIQPSRLPNGVTP